MAELSTGPSPHDVEADLYTALTAWDMAGRHTTPYPAVEHHLSRLPEGWAPPSGRTDPNGDSTAVSDWYSAYPGEPDTAALLLDYLQAASEATSATP